MSPSDKYMGIRVSRGHFLETVGGQSAGASHAWDPSQVHTAQLCDLGSNCTIEPQFSDVWSGHNTFLEGLVKN